jgi:hypothetical protein
MTRDCYVYIICHYENDQDIGPVKIGMSDNPTSRVGNLQSGNPKKIKLYKKYPTPDRTSAKYIEAMFHKNETKHMLTGEWFDITPEDAHKIMGAAFACSLYEMGVSYETATEVMEIVSAESMGLYDTHH